MDEVRVGAPDGGRKVVRTVRGERASDGAGVQLARLIGTRELPDLDPFLLLDEFGTDRPEDYLAGFPDHPHRGFETVTYMLAGRMRHRDNRGNEGLLGPGAVQWMTAARGIVHSEMPEQQDGLMRGFQLWVNLPAADKMGEPAYQDVPAERVPAFDRGDVRGRVVAGAFMGVESPVETGATEPLYLDMELQAGAVVDVPLPTGHAAFAYVHQGTARVGGTRLSRGDLGVLSPGPSVSLANGAGCARLLLVAGRPLGEPIARHGPFVMSTLDEIRQAVSDYRHGLI